jgi:ferrous iron transport protein A
MITNVAKLKAGDKALIKQIDNPQMALKLMEMGCLPGVAVQMSHTAPLGDPICIHVSGYTLALRKSEARAIQVEMFD